MPSPAEVAQFWSNRQHNRLEEAAHGEAHVKKDDNDCVEGRRVCKDPKNEKSEAIRLTVLVGDAVANPAKERGQRQGHMPIKIGYDGEYGRKVDRGLKRHWSITGGTFCHSHTSAHSGLLKWAQAGRTEGRHKALDLTGGQRELPSRQHEV